MKKKKAVGAGIVISPQAVNVDEEEAGEEWIV